jgi:hypothetical protein
MLKALIKPELAVANAVSDHAMLVINVEAMN